MKYGFVFPRADAYKAIEFAKLAEDAGWDAFFFWEPTYGIDAWVTLAAIARETSKIRLGTLLSPISRMRPWKIASEVLTLDILSNGRVTLSVGLGAIDTGFEELGEKTDRKTRAELLDEALDIMIGLWNWELSNYEGKHYKIKNLKECEFFTEHPPPKLIQRPRVPIWVVGAWSAKKSMERTMKYEGIIPTLRNKQGVAEKITPDHVRKICDYVNKHRSSISPFDIVIEGITPGDNFKIAKSIVTPFAEAGATWWIESDWIAPDLTKVQERVKQGPPN